MRVDRTLARHLVLVLGLTFSGDAMAQQVNFKVSFAGKVDCDQPFAVKNVPIRGDGNGVINADGSASADVTQTAFVLSTTVHFKGRLGAPPTPAPGGTAQVRVAGRDRLRLIWNLPHNQLIVHIMAKGQACAARFEALLKPGKKTYTLFDGQTYHYCGRPRVESSSCQIR